MTRVVREKHDPKDSKAPILYPKINGSVKQQEQNELRSSVPRQDSAR